jgi:hypothetical protein
MATLADVFAGDGFTIYAMSKAIEKIPAVPQTISSLGIFEDVPVAQTLVAVEENQGVLMLVPTTHRGGPGTKIAAEKRKVHNFKVPHIQIDDFMSADDVLNVRAFGSDQAQSVNDQLTRKLAVMRRSIDATTEYLRMGAISGLVAYPTNSVDSDINLFTAFGTSEQEVEFDPTNEDSTDIIVESCADVRDNVEDALGGTPYNGIYALCGREFFRALLLNSDLRDLYKQQTALLGAQQGVVDFARPNRMRVNFGGIIFEEYYGVVSGASFLADDEARFFPIGVPGLFQSIWAPADTVEAVGTLGQYIYAQQWSNSDGKSVQLQAQSNGLQICTRPRCLVKGTLAELSSE